MGLVLLATGNEISTVGGAVATAATSVAAGVTFGQIDELNQAVVDCAEYTADKAEKTMVYQGGKTAVCATATTLAVTCGDMKTAEKLANHTVDAAERFGKEVVTTGNGVLNGTPGVGHVKGFIHLACKDEEGAKEALMSANRTSAVLAAGIGGSLAGGPVGAVAAGLAAGPAMDGIHTGADSFDKGKFSPHGTIASWAAVHNGENPTQILDGVIGGIATHVLDGVTGFQGHKIVRKVKKGSGDGKKQKPKDENAFDAPEDSFEREFSELDLDSHTGDEISSDTLKWDDKGEMRFEYKANKDVANLFGAESKVIKLPKAIEGRGMQVIKGANGDLALLQHAGPGKYGPFSASQHMDLLKTLKRQITPGTETISLLGCEVPKSFALSLKDALKGTGIAVKVLKDFPKPPGWNMVLLVNEVQPNSFTITAWKYLADGNILHDRDFYITKPLDQLGNFLTDPENLVRK